MATIPSASPAFGLRCPPMPSDKTARLRSASQKEARGLEASVGITDVMHEVFVLISRLAPTDLTVTLIGETGTGKDVFAHRVHERSRRAAGPFVVFDCGAVPPNLIESELFGHERGSFTGAHAEHAGAFERAEGGTLFLDEIGELPLDLQPRLLRALDNRSVRRVGGTRDRRVDVRIVAATNRDLAALAASKAFRHDLYFRLATAIVRLPSLRERLEDLPALVSQILCDLGHERAVVSDATLEVLRVHSWPGNIRELKNGLSYALAFADSEVIEPFHLRLDATTAGASVLETLPLAGHSLKKLEMTAIRQTLLQTRGNKERAARLLGIALSTLYDKLR
jgi:DNA-binding NtrC family response regulator